MHGRLCLRCVASALLLVSLAACTSQPVVSDVVKGLYAERFSASHDPTAGAQLNPAYRYLRVEANGAVPALLVLGYVDSQPIGEVQVWYSATGEVLKLLDGRIVGTAGLATDWSRVTFLPAPPAWRDVTAAGAAFIRRRDEQPGYRADLTAPMRLVHWQGAPPLTLPASLAGESAQAFDWYQERAVDAQHGSLPPSWYAVGTYRGQRTVVYSEQCLSPKLCLKMQLWPPEKAS